MPAKKPSEVVIADQVKPVEVVIGTEQRGKGRGQKIVNKSEGKTLAPRTTQQEDLVTAGQRRVNLIWEFTQATIAISITWAIIYCSIKNLPKDVLTNAFFLIVSMYFVRTNHKLIGGVPQDAQKNER